MNAVELLPAKLLLARPFHRSFAPFLRRGNVVEIQPHPRGTVVLKPHPENQISAKTRGPASVKSDLRVDRWAFLFYHFLLLLWRTLIRTPLAITSNTKVILRRRPLCHLSTHWRRNWAKDIASSQSQSRKEVSS